MNKAQQIFKLFEGKIIKLEGSSLDTSIYNQIKDQLKGSLNKWIPVTLDNDSKQKQIEAQSPSKGNLQFRVPVKPEIDEEKNFFRIKYNLYKFNNKGILQNPVTIYQGFDTKDDMLKALEPFKK